MPREPAATIERTVIDGVPVYWCPTPPTAHEPACVGSLLFGVGCADESVNTRGISHLVEHLTLYPFGAHPSHPINGTTDSLRTGFHVSGTSAQVTDFMARVCESLTRLPLDRLEAESRVLRTEAVGRRSSLESRFLFLRYGARGIGLLEIPEFALEVTDPAAVSQWAAKHFTRENACAWIWGCSPESLRFPALPAGQRRTDPPSRPIDDLRMPAVVVGDPGGIGMSFVCERDTWLSVPFSIARKRLLEHLRFVKGLTYEIDLGVAPISSAKSHAQLSTGCLPEHTERVQHAIFEVLDTLAREGPYLDELEDYSKEMEKSDANPDAVGSELDRHAFNELVGYPNMSTAEFLADFARRTREDWAASMRAALASLILMLPQGVPPPEGRLSLYPNWSKRLLRGRRFRATAWRFPWRRKFPELVVGTEGVSMVMPQGHGITVKYAQCAGAVLQRDGRLDLFGDDGFCIRIVAKEWRNGERARADILGALSGDRVLVVPKTLGERPPA